MNAIELLVQTLQATQQYLSDTLVDFTDADMLVRPVPGANHAAWQLTHLIASEVQMVKMVVPNAVMPALDADLLRKTEKAAAATLNSPADFPSKAELLALFAQVRQAAIASVKTLSESDLDKLTGFAHSPNVGQFLALLNGHTVMHLGQFQVIRRKLGKPILF